MEKLKIAIDAREAYRAQRTGKGQWARCVIEELAHRPQVQLTLFGDAERPHGLPETAQWKRLAGSGFWWHWNVAQMLVRQSSVDVYLSPTSFIVPALVHGRFPVIPVVHDLIAFRHEPHQRRAQAIERLTLSRAVDRAPVILTVSDSTRADLLARYATLRADHVVSVSAGSQHGVTARNQTDGKTIFCLGTLCPRKNQLRLIQAYAELPSPLRSHATLVLAGGRGWRDHPIVDLADRTPGVTWLGYVSDAQYEHLLSTCAVFALPSLYEGFGLPVLDALQHGACVVTSNRGSLKEVAGDAALTVDPESVVSIRDGLLAALTDGALRERLQERGPIRAAQFTWEKTADGILRAIAQAVD